MVDIIIENLRNNFKTDCLVGIFNFYLILKKLEW